MLLAAASDLLLAATCTGAMIVRLRAAPSSGRVAMLIGWSVLAAAALVGAWRYAIASEWAGTHRALSDLGAGFGMPAIVLGLVLSWRTVAPRVEGALLLMLAVIFTGALLADNPRLPGTALTLLGAVAAIVVVPPTLRAAGTVSLVALLASAGFALALPREAAVVGLHLALAVVQAGWCRAVWAGGPHRRGDGPPAFDRQAWHS